MEVQTFVRVEGRKYNISAGQGVIIGVLTSGPDAQGINAAVRAALRMGLYMECKVYFIKEGFQGMIDGGNNIVPATWASANNIIQMGGTVLGSSQSNEFHERAGRLKAVYNLVNLGITNLVGIGGEGTLSALFVLKQEWHQHIVELIESNRISPDKGAACSNLNIMGIMASIENEFCSTDMSVGTDSALNRVMESLDSIQTAAISQHRCFVLEVVGRHSGYLALSAALAAEADWLFIPEYPPEKGWEEMMFNKLLMARDSDQKMNLVIIAEGAIDHTKKPISAVQVKELIKDNVKCDTKVTVLGHVQRGGCPSAFDRILASRLGAEAVMCLLDSSKETMPMVVALQGNQIVRHSLAETLAKFKSIKNMMEEFDYEGVLNTRGLLFKNMLNIYCMLSSISPPVSHNVKNKYVFGIICLGVPSCGINSSLRTFVRCVNKSGYSVYAIYHGFEGLMQNQVELLTWENVQGWTKDGGCNIGCSTYLIDQFGVDKIALQMRKFKIAALLLVGGFEAFHAALIMGESRAKHIEFCIPICVIPASPFNNLPGTEVSIGSDTVLNKITELCDRTRLSATGSKNRVFLFETIGGKCGYLTTMSALATAADIAYIYEESFGIKEIMTDLVQVAIKVRHGSNIGIVLMSDESHPSYNLDFLSRVYSHEGRSAFITKKIALKEIQDGGRPSPYDRLLAIKLASRTAEHLIAQLNENLTSSGNTINFDTCTLAGLVKHQIDFTPVQELKKQYNFYNRNTRETWWMHLKSLAKTLVHYDPLFIQSQTASNADTKREDIKLETKMHSRAQ
ncbi:hypothetical protein HELRODRAFT_63192 [Helobdella robusta]|uniref:6-phosphofructokinase n=1 Tax=Helobdella robusta TaxID=6412 RepID=T1FXB9_HELRO|nr:hypothetical protein HELRODRAFT_63192 [Helobdella robusta]ESO12358.1 hypothetical protein HELRODRAFT_63192 [Helobdella robusta]